MHRSGRTARIGRSGESLALLDAADEKNFKTIRSVLKSGDQDPLEMLDVKYAQLELMRSVVDAAKEIEKDSHRKQADEKSANWLLKKAKEADLDLDDDLKHEV